MYQLTPLGTSRPDDAAETEQWATDAPRERWPEAPRTPSPPRSTRGASLFSQVLAVNTVIIIGTVFTASVAARLDLHTAEGLESFLIAILAILVTALVNAWVLRRRFRPLERLLHSIDRVDLERPTINASPERGEPADVAALRDGVQGMLDRLDLERRRRATSVLAAQEAERGRLARDLHDEVNQSLTGIMLRLSVLAGDADPQTREGLAEVRELTDQAMRELLRLSHDLRPTALDDLGLTAALGARLDQLKRDTKLSVERDIDTSLPALGSERQTVVFRVAQEAISNVIQHAGATRVRVSLTSCGTDSVRLCVSDDGCGIDASAAEHAERRGRAGVTGMRERAILVGGSLRVLSGAQGTTVELVV